MQRIIIIAKGEVQKVGYRDTVQKIARKFEVVGFAENLESGDVRIVAEGENEILKRFAEAVKINKFPIFVEKIETEFAEATKEFKYFQIKRGDWKEELGERFDVAGTLLYRSVELGEKSIELGEKSIELGEKSIELGEKSIKIGEKNLEHGDKMLEKQDQTINIIKESTNETKEFRKENKGILKEFHQDTIKRFDTVDIKYGRIAENMEKILQEMKEERKEFRETIERLIGTILERK